MGKRHEISQQCSSCRAFIIGDVILKKKRKKKSHHDSDSRLCHQLKKINKNQPGFFPLYTQKAGPAAIKEIRGENLAHFLFVKQLCWSRFKEIKDLYSPLV